MLSVSLPTNGSIDIEYSQSSELYDDNDELLNPNMRIPMTVVTEISIDDGLGNNTVSEYTYEGGGYDDRNDYPNNVRVRGFDEISETIPDANLRIVKNYRMYGEGVDNTSPEFFNKIIYRGYFDLATGEQLKEEVYDWRELDQSAGNTQFVLLEGYSIGFRDANDDDIASGKEFEYESTYGDLIQTIDNGETRWKGGAGGISNSSGDEYYINYEYAQSGHISRPTQETTIDTDEITVLRQTRYHYDGLPFSYAGNAGNVTKIRTKLIPSNTWLDTNMTYNSAGIMTSTTNPRGHTTTLNPSSDNLYIASEQNALGYTTSYTYDYTTGQITSTFDPNGIQTTTDFDGLARPIQSKSTGTNGSLYTTDSWSYNTSLTPQRTIHQQYITSQPIATYTYTDGLGRTIQTKSANTNGDYTAVYFDYDDSGRLQYQTVPYNTSSTSYQASSARDTEYIYDAIARITEEETPTGDTQFAYTYQNDFTKVTTDPRGNIYKHTYDARGNLTDVEEPGNDFFATEYQYDTLSRLIYVIDNLFSGNDTVYYERAVTYDSLDRILTNELPHEAGTVGGPTLMYTMQTTIRSLKLCPMVLRLSIPMINWTVSPVATAHVAVVWKTPTPTTRAQTA